MSWKSELRKEDENLTVQERVASNLLYLKLWPLWTQSCGERHFPQRVLRRDEPALTPYRYESPVEDTPQQNLD